MDDSFDKYLEEDAAELRNGPRREISITVPASGQPRYADDTVTFDDDGVSIRRVPSNDHEGLVEILRSLVDHIQDQRILAAGKEADPEGSGTLYRADPTPEQVDAMKAALAKEAEGS